MLVTSKLQTDLHFFFLYNYLILLVYREKGAYVYQLKAVLLHLGQSASAGHYIAHIQDEVTKQWWKFDDTKVTTLDLKEVGDTESQVFEVEKGTREKAKSLLSSLGKKKVTSHNAYMVVYTKVRDRIIQTPQPPKVISQCVAKANEVHLAKYNAWAERKTEIKAAFLHHRDIYQNFMNLSTSVVGEPFQWVDAKWFSKWVCGDISPVNNTEILCVHQKVDPRKIHRLKIMHSKAWDFLMEHTGGGGPKLGGADCCMDCASELYEGNSIVIVIIVY